jgi:hypothetical protein
MRTPWWYGSERETKNLRAKCGYKCKVKSSIAETVLNKVSNFTVKYYDENISTEHNPLLHLQDRRLVCLYSAPVSYIKLEHDVLVGDNRLQHLISLMRH